MSRPDSWGHKNGHFCSAGRSGDQLKTQKGPFLFRGAAGQQIRAVNETEVDRE